MKKSVLISFYSRTGSNKKIGIEIAKKIGADYENIIDKTDWGGVFGYIKGGFHAFKKKETNIEFKKNPYNYSMIILGTPIWAGKMTPALRTYIKLNINYLKSKKVALFSVSGSGEGSGFSEEFNVITGIKPVAFLSLKTFEVKKDDYSSKLKDFIEKINKK